MIHFITWLAWACILIAVLMGLLSSLVTVAMYLIVLGLVLLFGVSFYRSKHPGD